MNRTLEILISKYPELDTCTDAIEYTYGLVRNCFQKGGKLLVCGNGGSAADSEHIVGELMKGFISKRPLPEALTQKFTEFFPENGSYLAAHLQGALPAISLSSQTAFLTAYANDVASDMIFAQQVYGYGQPDDIVLGISTSGSSKNILHAFQVARVIGMHTIGLTGRTGGRFPEFCDALIYVPWDLTHEVQERHLAIYHALCAMLEMEFFPDEHPGRH